MHCVIIFKQSFNKFQTKKKLDFKDFFERKKIL